AEARALRNLDATLLRLDRLAERVLGEVAIEPFDERLARHGGDAVDRRQQARTEVRRVRNDLHAERVGDRHHAPHLRDAADLRDARLRVRDGARLARAAKVPAGAVVLAGGRRDASADADL